MEKFMTVLCVARQLREMVLSVDPFFWTFFQCEDKSGIHIKAKDWRARIELHGAHDFKIGDDEIVQKILFSIRRSENRSRMQIWFDDDHLVYDLTNLGDQNMLNHFEAPYVLSHAKIFLPDCCARCVGYTQIHNSIED